MRLLVIAAVATFLPMAVHAESIRDVAGGQNSVRLVGTSLPRILDARVAGYPLKKSPGKITYGFIAEWMGDTFPELQGRDANGTISSFDMLGMFPFVVKAEQELYHDILNVSNVVDRQQIEIDLLKKQLAADDARITALEARH